MSIAFSVHGNPVVVQPSNKVLISALVVFALGVFFLGLVGCAVLVGIGLVLWNVGTVVLHLLIAVVATDLLVQGVGCLLLVFALMGLVIFFMRFIWSAVCSPKPSNEGMHS